MRGKTTALLIILALAVAMSAVARGLTEQTDTQSSSPAVKPSVSVLQERAGAILKNSCAVPGCHTGKHPEQKLALDPQLLPGSMKNVPSREVKTLKLVDTTNPAKSYLLMKLRGDKGIKGKRMPRGGEPLTEPQISTISQWIEGLAAADSSAAAKGAKR